MRFGSLYTGLGGFDHGLATAGWTCAWTAERDQALRRQLEGRQLWANHFADAASVPRHGTQVDLVYAEVPSPDWRYAAPAIEAALGLGRALVLEGSPSTWEAAKGRIYVQLRDGSQPWRTAARVMRYVSGDETGRSFARKRLVVVASPYFDPAALLDGLGIGDTTALTDAPTATDATAIVETRVASIADLTRARGFPNGWTDGLSEAAARQALGEATSPSIGLVFGRALTAALKA